MLRDRELNLSEIEDYLQDRASRVVTPLDSSANDELPKHVKEYLGVISDEVNLGVFTSPEGHTDPTENRSFSAANILRFLASTHEHTPDELTVLLVPKSNPEDYAVHAMDPLFLQLKSKNGVVTADIKE